MIVINPQKKTNDFVHIIVDNLKKIWLNNI